MPTIPDDYTPPAHAGDDRVMGHPESDDNWRHRSAKMKCRSCMWYAPKKDTIGRCRRRSPSMNGWPVMFETDWCGDHKLNEEALG